MRKILEKDKLLKKYPYLEKIIDNLLSYYKENGLEKERLSSFIDRIGIQEIKQSVI